MYTSDPTSDGILKPARAEKLRPVIFGPSTAAERLNWLIVKRLKYEIIHFRIVVSS